MLYAVYPRLTEARALYRPGDDPSVESQASTHMQVMVRNSEGPRRQPPKRKKWPEEPPDEEVVTPAQPGDVVTGGTATGPTEPKAKAAIPLPTIME
eukprot:8150794-Prorocentrum_lima.AAC.1